MTSRDRSRMILGTMLVSMSAGFAIGTMDLFNFLVLVVVVWGVLSIALEIRRRQNES